MKLQALAQRQAFGRSPTVNRNSSVSARPNRSAGEGVATRYVYSGFEAVAVYVRQHDLIIGNSTVSTGTAPHLLKLFCQKQPKVRLPWNPNFVREVAFIIAMANTCGMTGADVVRLSGGIERDDRSGRMTLGAGLGCHGPPYEGCLCTHDHGYVTRRLWHQGASSC